MRVSGRPSSHGGSLQPASTLDLAIRATDVFQSGGLPGPALVHDSSAEPRTSDAGRKVPVLDDAADNAAPQTVFPQWGSYMCMPQRAQRGWAAHAAKPGATFVAWLVCYLGTNLIFFPTFYIGSNTLYQNIMALIRLPSAAGLLMCTWIMGPGFLVTNKVGNTWYLVDLIAGFSCMFPSAFRTVSVLPWQNRVAFIASYFGAHLDIHALAHAWPVRVCLVPAVHAHIAAMMPRIVC